jgi:CRP-like cAMP-binding protein
VSEPTIDASRTHEFLKGISDQHRTVLVSASKPFHAAPGEYLAREGEPAGAFYLIQTGRVHIGAHLRAQGAAPMQTVGPGDVVGWSWLLPPYVWQFDARAIDAVHGLFFDAAWLRSECERNHELGYHLLKQLVAVVSSRLAACRIQHLDIYK